MPPRSTICLADKLIGPLGALFFRVGGNVVKRFHDTEIWKQDWFIEMDIEYRILWLYIKDACDHAGIWKPEKKFVEFLTGKEIDLNKGIELFNRQKERVLLLGNGRWFLRDFITFQYGQTLNVENRVHASIKALLEVNEVNLRSIRGQLDPKDSPKDKDKDIDIDVKDVREGMGGIKKDKVLEWFEKLWKNYPKERRVGKAASFRSFTKRVKTLEDALWVASALHNYLESKTVSDGFIKNASTFFANVEDYADERRDQPGVISAPIERSPDNAGSQLRGLTSAARILDGLTGHASVGNKPKTESP